MEFWDPLPTLWKVLLGVAAFVGGGSVVGFVIKMITRPRLRALFQPTALEEMPLFSYKLPNGQEVNARSFIIRTFVWNDGLSPADDCTVAVDGVWLDGEKRVSKFARSPLKWSLRSGGDQFAPRKLLPGKANGLTVDVCKTDEYDPTLHIMSEESFVTHHEHRFSEPGTYLVVLWAQSSSFWATPSRCLMWLNYERHEDGSVGLSIGGTGEHRHLLKMI